MSYKADILKAITRFGTTNGTKNPDERSNTGQLLGEVFLWETARDLCADRAKSAWADLESMELYSDADLRSLGESESIVVKSPHFALSVKVSKPRMMFDRDLFIERIAADFKIDKHRLIELATTCKAASKPPLSKKVLEVE
jgi:hypothetical protein